MPEKKIGTLESVSRGQISEGILIGALVFAAVLAMHIASWLESASASKACLWTDQHSIRVRFQHHALQANRACVCDPNGLFWTSRGLDRLRTSVTDPGYHSVTLFGLI